MRAIPTTPTASWYADGLRWIGSLLTGAANYLDRPSIEPAPFEHPEYQPVEEYLFDVRHRMQNRF